MREPKPEPSNWIFRYEKLNPVTKKKDGGSDQDFPTEYQGSRRKMITERAKGSVDSWALARNREGESVCIGRVRCAWVVFLNRFGETRSLYSVTWLHCGDLLALINFFKNSFSVYSCSSFTHFVLFFSFSFFLKKKTYLPYSSFFYYSIFGIFLFFTITFISSLLLFLIKWYQYFPLNYNFFYTIQLYFY